MGKMNRATVTDTITRRDVMRAGGVAAIAMLASQRAAAAPLTATEEASLDAVRQFASGWAENDPEKVVSPFADDCVVRWTAQNLDAAPFEGKEAFLTRVRGALSSQAIEMQITEMYALEPIVVNIHHQLFERRDNSTRTEDLYIGLYFFRDGKIQEWLDYAVFDPQPRKAREPGFDRFTRVDA